MVWWRVQGLPGGEGCGGGGSSGAGSEKKKPTQEKPREHGRPPNGPRHLCRAEAQHSTPRRPQGLLGNKKAPRSLPFLSGLARTTRDAAERARAPGPGRGKQAAGPGPGGRGPGLQRRRAGAPREGRGVYSHVLAGRGPHRRLEHLLTHGAVEVIFRVGRGRRKLLGHGEGWAGEAAAPAGAEVAVAARSPTP